MNYSVVIPVYNSSKTLPVLIEELNTVMFGMNTTFEIIFVDDCSTDSSWETLLSIKKQYPHVKILRLLNNVGQWMATLAGISKSKGSYIITIDDDLEYDTKDIQLLVDESKKDDVYLVYGIPTEKKNKNLSYKIFFKLRDRFLRLFFDKIQTESFKIFNREIYLDEHNEMISHLHFEAYTKFTVAKKYIRLVSVNYRKRYFGNSNHTLLMKAMLMIRYGIEYYKSPFKYPLYLLFLSINIYFITIYFSAHNTITIFIDYFISMVGLLILGIIGNYLSSLYFKLKGLPEYIIIEEY